MRKNKFARKTSVLIVFLCLLFGPSILAPTVLHADVQTRAVEYEHNGVQLEGYLAFDDSLEGTQPGVMIVHQWMGLGHYEKQRARQLADMGYVAFAADIYGADTRPETTHEASLASSTFRDDRGKYRRRLKRSLDVLADIDQVNSDELAAIGYCFGGTGVLELARSKNQSGPTPDAVVSFHGGLSNPNPDDAKNIQSTVQVHHGAKDQHVTQDDVLSFWNEMDKHASIEWDLNVYSNANHGFTEANTDAYNERADQLSWQRMRRLFDEVFNQEDDI